MDEYLDNLNDNNEIVEEETDYTMGYEVFFDNNGYITGFQHTDSELDEYFFDANDLEGHYLNAYKMVEGVPVLDEEREAQLIQEEEERRQRPTEMQILEAQTTYTAMMTDTLLEESSPSVEGEQLIEEDGEL